MKVINKSDNSYIMRFDFDEDVVHGIINFCEHIGIESAYFSGLGACQKVTLSYYDLVNKKYLDNDYIENLEIVSLTGNVGLLDSKKIVHAHGVFSDRTYKTYGGHVKNLVVSATCEIHLTKLTGQMNRSYDNKTGLNLLE